MSACWVSRVLARDEGDAGATARLRALLAVLAALSLAISIAPAAHAARAAHRDSGKVVRHIRISDEGVRYEGSGADTTEVRGSSGDDESGGTITIGDRRRRVHIHDLNVSVNRGGKNVRVMGPVVLVDDEGAGLVRVFSDAEVDSGQRIEGDVVAVFGSVTVRGQVTGNAVAVLGNVKLERGASIEGDAVAVGGTLDQAPGSTVNGQTVSLGFLPIAWGLPALPIVLFAVLIGWLSTLFMGWFLQLLFARRMLRVAVTAARRTGISLLLGLVSAPLLIIAMVLLAITVLGIPVAVLLPIFYGLMMWGGQIAASHVIGSKLLRRPLGQGGAMLPVAVGTLFVAAFFVLGAAFGIGSGSARWVALFFHLLGLLLLMGLTTVGTGAFLLSGLGARPADVGAEPAPHAGAGLAGTAAPAPAPGSPSAQTT